MKILSGQPDPLTQLIVGIGVPMTIGLFDELLFGDEYVNNSMSPHFVVAMSQRQGVLSVLQTMGIVEVGNPGHIRTG